MFSRNKLKTIAILFFFIFALVRISLPVIKNWHLYTTPYDAKLYERKYNASQYVIPQSKHPISDEELLSHAGYEYVHGLNPILINSDHPPLGKYIIGWFTVLFNNNRIVGVFFGYANFILIMTMVYLLTRSLLLSSFSALMLSFDTMLVDQMIHSPIMDIIQVFFFLLAVLVFYFWLKRQTLSLLILEGIMLGCLSAVKLYFPTLVFFGSVFLVLLAVPLKLKKIISYYLAVIPVAVTTYSLTYLTFFLKGNSLRAFFGVQKWIFLFWQNNSIDRSKIFANVIPFILANRWKVWWGNTPYISYENWSILWPIVFIVATCISVIVIVRYFRTKKHTTLLSFMLLLSIWQIFFTAYLCFIPISPRYLLMLFFPSYVLMAVSVGYIFISPIHEKKHHT